MLNLRNYSHMNRRDSVGITNFLLGVVGFLEDVGIVSDWFLVDGGIFKIFPRSQNCEKNQLFFYYFGWANRAEAS